MDRRNFLNFSAAGVGLSLINQANSEPLVPGDMLVEGDYDNGAGLLSWNSFLERAVEKANSLINDRSQEGQDAYLYNLASLASRLGELPEVSPRDFGDLTPAYLLNLIFRDSDSPFVILYWKLEPGAIFPAHCHPGGNVCTLCTSGSAIIRNYDTAADAPRCWEDADDEFDVFENKKELLRPGVVNTVTEFRNNIHRFEAGPEGAQGIDISTGYDDDPKPFSYLQLADSVNGKNGQTKYRGNWVGKDIKRAI